MNVLKQTIAWFKKECPACQATGITTCHCNEHYEIVCPECMGKGVIDECVTASNIVEIPCDHPECQNGTVPCSYCQGSGKTSDGDTCSYCQGSGRVECPLCQGTGRIKRKHQEQWIAHRQCPTCGGRRYVACPYCHGTKNRVCPVCHGEGEVWNKGRLAIAGLGVLVLTMMPMIAITVLGFAAAGLTLYLACQYFPPQAAKEPQPAEKGETSPSEQDGEMS